MSRQPTIRLAWLEILASRNDGFVNAEGSALQDLFEAGSEIGSTISAFHQLISTMRSQHLIETLSDRGVVCAVDITETGREYLRQHMNGSVHTQPISQTEPVKAQIPLNELMNQFSERIQEIHDGIVRVSILEEENATLRESLAATERRLQLVQEDRTRLNREIGKLELKPRITLKLHELPKCWRELGKAALQQGWSIQKTSNNHLQWISPNGYEPYYSSFDTTDPHAIKNTRAQLIQRGLTGA